MWIVAKTRKRQGSAQISEFAVALLFLFGFVVLPLINLCVVPLRFSLGKSIVSSRVHELAQSETLSQALKIDAGDSTAMSPIHGQPVTQGQPVIQEQPKIQGQPVMQRQPATQLHSGSKAVSAEEGKASIRERLSKIGGITIRSSELTLTIESQKRQGEIKVVSEAGSISRDWLPDGPFGPYIYRLDLSVNCDISPLVVVALPNPKIPGLTAPFAMQYHETSVWENTGRDPVSGEFYVNE